MAAQIYIVHSLSSDEAGVWEELFFSFSPFPSAFCVPLICRTKDEEGQKFGKNKETVLKGS